MAEKREKRRHIWKKLGIIAVILVVIIVFGLDFRQINFDKIVAADHTQHTLYVSGNYIYYDASGGGIFMMNAQGEQEKICDTKTVTRLTGNDKYIYYEEDYVLHQVDYNGEEIARKNLKQYLDEEAFFDSELPERDALYEFYANDNYLYVYVFWSDYRTEGKNNLYYFSADDIQKSVAPDITEQMIEDAFGKIEYDLAEYDLAVVQTKFMKYVFEAYDSGDLSVEADESGCVTMDGGIINLVDSQTGNGIGRRITQAKDGNVYLDYFGFFKIDHEKWSYKMIAEDPYGNAGVPLGTTGLSKGIYIVDMPWYITGRYNSNCNKGRALLSKGDILYYIDSDGFSIKHQYKLPLWHVLIYADDEQYVVYYRGCLYWYDAETQDCLRKQRMKGCYNFKTYTFETCRDKIFMYDQTGKMIECINL